MRSRCVCPELCGIVGMGSERRHLTLPESRNSRTPFLSERTIQCRARESVLRLSGTRPLTRLKRVLRWQHPNSPFFRMMQCEGGKIVKRILALLVCLVVFTASAAPALACRRHHRSYASYGNRPLRYRRVAYRTYPTRSYYAYHSRRSFWQRHRDALTMAIGTGGGTGVGALLGGRRGAGIGALAGLGSSALYTYKLRNRHRRY
jgi:hypothetical protein